MRPVARDALPTRKGCDSQERRFYWRDDIASGKEPIRNAYRCTGAVAFIDRLDLTCRKDLRMKSLRFRQPCETTSYKKLGDA